MGGGPQYELLRPITDEFADYIGVERRKYLTFDNQDEILYFKKDDGKRCYAISNKLFNFDTSYYFHVDKRLLKMKTVCYDMHFENTDNTIDIKRVSLNIYEGKIKMIAPIPIYSLMITDYMAEKIKNTDLNDLYLECFDLSDVPEIYVYKEHEDVYPVDASTVLSSISSNYDNYEV